VPVVQGALSELLSGGDFEAKQGSASRALRLGKAAGAAAGPRYVALLGLGKGEALAKPAGERYGANPYQVRAALQLCLVEGDSDTEQCRKEKAWHVGQLRYKHSMASLYVVGSIPCRRSPRAGNVKLVPVHESQPSACSVACQLMHGSE
jgi:hypothetical protein